MRDIIVLVAMILAGHVAALRLLALGAGLVDAVVGAMALAALVGFVDDTLVWWRDRRVPAKERATRAGSK